MARLVMKFGGTSVATVERIKNAARHVKREFDAGNQVAVVVSAMSGKTNELVAWCKEASPVFDQAEYDTVVASGEQVTSGLMAIVLQEMGLPARSWQGWQIPLYGSDAHGSARIEGVDGAGILAGFDRNREIAVCSGFQGINPRSHRIVTLGRGGSDTSAVALAAGLKADRCDIYTDVDGVYTTDPRIVPHARKLDLVTYEEMLELASVGAKVLQTRSVGLAMRYNMPLTVLSSFEDKPGTKIVGEDFALGQIEEMDMERNVITGIAHDKNEAMVTLTGLPDKAGTVAAIFAPLAAANVNVDMIVQSVPRPGEPSVLTFTVPTASLAHSVAELNKVKDAIGFDEILTDTNVVKVSAVGVGMRSNAGIAAKMFQTLADRGINILAITTSEIKVSVLIPEEYMELAVRVLHTAYGLDAERAA